MHQAPLLLEGTGEAINIHHHQACQPRCRLLAPAPQLARLRQCLVECRLKDECWQLALQCRIVRLTILVYVLVPLRRPDERPELSLVAT